MPGPPKYSGSIGKVKFHVTCAYHGQLGIADSEDEAYKLSAAHLRARHADAEKKVSSTSEVTISAILHFQAADLEHFAQS